MSIAFERPDGGVVVVVLNQNPDPVEITLKDNANQVSHLIKGHSIQSYLYY